MSTATTDPEPPPLRRRPIPVTQPRPALRVASKEPGPAPAVQETLLLHVDPVEANDAAPGRTAGPSAKAVRDLDDEAAAERFAAPQRTPSHVLPEPRRWAAQFVQAATEVSSGLRPPSQLIRWTSDEVRSSLLRRAALARSQAAHNQAARSQAARTRQPQRSIVRSARVSTPCDGVAEATVVITDGRRARAVALRLEGLDGRWRVTALQLG